MLSSIFSKVHASRQDILYAEKGNIENELVFSIEQLDTNDHDSMKHDQGDKLDRIMHVLFEYITNTALPNGNDKTSSNFDCFSF